MPALESNAADWPGRGLGLPATGARSITRMGRRIVALAIDWALAVGVSIAFFDYEPFATLAVFAVAQAVLLLIANGSIGHLITRSRVVPVKGGYLGAWRPLVRTILLCLVIPAVIWDRDQRGMHDRLAGTMLVRV
jgi:hypothetical protein